MHPDADLLTAFAEQALPIRERNSVLAHLSQCADCREVVLVAAPQVEGAVQEIPVRSSWLGWPALRWGALAACAVVVVAAVSLRPKFEPRPAASKEAAPQVTAKLMEPAPEKKIIVADKLEKDRATMQSAPRDLAKSSARVSAPPASAESRAKAAPVALPAAPVQTDKLAVSSGMVAATPAESRPAAANLTAMAGPAARVPSTNEPVSVNAETATVAAKTAESSLGKAKQALADESLDSKTQRADARRELASPALANSLTAYKKAIPRWTLSADGTLQRSLDAGKSWKTIPVAADATFTAVAAMASDIWVGGSHGALYHSVDAGEHWTQVTPAADGQPLTSNIIGIEFTDSLHGKVTTSNQEIWTTSDGGETWETSH